MPTSVPITPKSIEDYRPYANESQLEEILGLADALKGARVLHINATSYGGGVAELLNSMVPLLCGLGLEAEWQVLDAPGDFFDVTKAMHNAMQGMYIPWNTAMAASWRRVNQANADAISKEYDFVYVHDPQPAGVLRFVRERDPNSLGAKWIWRCHLDTTDALPEAWSFLRSYVSEYDALVFTLDEYLKEPVEGPLFRTVCPAIDPLSTKNARISPTVIHDILDRYEIDPDRPFITQVSRFDPWKDPLGVIDVYRLLKEERPDLQLLLAAAMANDDPEAWSFYERVVRKAGEDFDIHVLTNLNGIGNLEINAFQTAANVVMQKSIREGFGLVVSEALWKGRAFVGSHAGGIPLQLDHGGAGRLADTTEEFARHIGGLLDDHDLAKQLGEAGREHVRKNFLTTRLLLDHLRLMSDLSNGTPASEALGNETTLRGH